MDNMAIDSVEMQVVELSTGPSNKRKRETDDDGGQEQKKVQIENGTPGIEALHRDVGPPYRLSSARKTPFSALIPFEILSHFMANFLVNIDFHH